FHSVLAVGTDLRRNSFRTATVREGCQSRWVMINLPRWVMVNLRRTTCGRRFKGSKFARSRIAAKKEVAQTHKCDKAIQREHQTECQMSKAAMHASELDRARPNAPMFDKRVLVPTFACLYSAVVGPLIYFASDPGRTLENIMESRWENRIF